MQDRVMKQSSMQRKITVWAAAAALGLGAVGVSLSMAADKEAEKDSDITEVMKKGFKGSKKPPVPSIVKKALDGTATKDELAKLLEYSKTLQKAKPPKGEQKDWDERTGGLVKATEEIIKGEKAGAENLKAASDCKACHKLHHPD